MTTPFDPSETELPGVLRGSWHRFLEVYEPLRADLYRYCRHLTRSPWDAEDLCQDALARAYVTLGQLGEAPAHPKAWLFRVASNLWIDQARRRRVEAPAHDAEPARASTAEPRASREAAGTLLSRLPPQERAALGVASWSSPNPRPPRPACQLHPCSTPSVRPSMPATWGR